MTTPSTPPATPRAPRRGFRLGHWFLICFAALVVVAVVEAASMFRLNREAGEVRAAIDRVIAGEASTEVQFSVGSGAIGLVRFVAGFIDEVPPEALKALEAVNHASVGVYKLTSRPDEATRVEMMQVTAAQMESEGWHRVVAVHDGSDLVMVFAPADAHDPDELQLCVVVCGDTELVVVSANGRAGPLREIAEMHAGEWRRSLRQDRADVM